MRWNKEVIDIYIKQKYTVTNIRMFRKLTNYPIIIITYIKIIDC